VQHPSIHSIQYLLNSFLVHAVNLFCPYFLHLPGKRVYCAVSKTKTTSTSRAAYSNDTTVFQLSQPSRPPSTACSLLPAPTVVSGCVIVPIELVCSCPLSPSSLLTCQLAQASLLLHHLPVHLPLQLCVWLPGRACAARTTWAVGQLGSRSAPPHARCSSGLGLYLKEQCQQHSALQADLDSHRLRAAPPGDPRRAPLSLQSEGEAVPGLQQLVEDRGDTAGNLTRTLLMRWRT
jgi:hypothetical protein